LEQNDDHAHDGLCHPVDLGAVAGVLSLRRYSVFAIGVFSNKWMQWAVLASLAILLAIIYVPALDAVFGTTFLTLRDWLIMWPLILLPSVAAEVNKWLLRKRSEKDLLARVGA
jgi:Ca2+-transporting ATPase